MAGRKFDEVATAPPKSLTSDRFVFFIFLLCLASIIGQSLLILVSLAKLPEQVPLFYSRPWGEAILAPPFALGLLPLLALISLVANFGLGFFCFWGNRYLVRILVTFAGLVGVMTFYDTFKIIRLLT